MHKNKISFLCVLALLLLSFGFSLESSTSCDAKTVVVDELGNVFLLYDTYVERKSPVGKEFFRSSDFNFGEIEYLDVTNPLKPFLHFRQAGKLVFFDNTLSQQGEAMDLFSLDYGQIELVAGSRGDSFWLWESVNSEMIRTDKNFQKITSTGNLSVLLGRELHPSQILERGDYIYLVDATYGVLVFDIYGAYRSTLKLYPENGIQSVNNQLIFMEKGQIVILGSDWINADNVQLPADGVVSFAYFNQKFFLLRKGFFEIWSQ